MSRTKRRPKIKTIAPDAAAYLKSDDHINYCLKAAFEDGAALGDVARAKGMPTGGSGPDRRSY